MKVTTEKPGPGMAALTVEVPAEDFERAVDQAWRRLAQRVNVPGFRRGKAPRPLVERQVGPAAIDEEALRRLLPEQYDAAVDEAKITPIARPEFDVVQLERGKPLIFKATVAVRPQVEVGDLDSLEIEPETVQIDEAEVQRVIDRLRESQAQWIPVEDRGVADGDMIITDMTIALEPDESGKPRTTERKDAEVILGQHGFPEGFDAAVRDMRPGETREFPLEWGTRPAGEGEEPVARTATFTVTVKDLKRKQLPELDDEFAKSLGEHDTLDALTGDVRRRLYDEAVRSARVAVENKAIDAAVARTTFEIADRLIELETDALVQERQRTLADQRLTVERYLQLLGKTQEEWRSELREQAERQLKARLLLDTLAERDGITVTPEEVEAEIERTAVAYGEAAAQVRKALAGEDSRRRIVTSLRRQKALEGLVARAGGYPSTESEEAAGAAPAASAADAEGEQQPQPEGAASR